MADLPEAAGSACPDLITPLCHQYG
jgi:hypothetical protein